MIQAVGIVEIRSSRGGVSKSGVAWARAQAVYQGGFAEIVAFGALAGAVAEGRKLFLSGTPREETYEGEGVQTKVTIQADSLEVLEEKAELTPLSMVGAGILASEPRPTSKGNYLSRVGFRNYRGGRREDIFLSVVTAQPAGNKGEGIVILRGRLTGSIVVAGEIIKTQRESTATRTSELEEFELELSF